MPVHDPASGAIIIRVTPRQLTGGLAAGAAVLILLGAVTIVLRYGYGHDYARGLVPKFDLDRELNVPTWFSSSLLLLAAALLAAIARAKRSASDPFGRHWVVLAAIFLLLSIDEAASIHGLPGAHLRAAFDLPGFLHYAWVIPGMALVAVFAVAYLRFLRHLPEGTRRLVAAAGVLFAGGALGGEMAQGAYRVAYGDGATFGIIALVEETLEMSGVIVFLYALAEYIRREYRSVRVEFGDEPAASTAGAAAHRVALDLEPPRRGGAPHRTEC